MFKKRPIRKITDPWLSSQDQKEYVPKGGFWAKSDDLCQLMENAGTVALWDFHTALGDTLNEKYESLYLKLSELTNVLITKGAEGYFWAAGGIEICSLFECTSNFNPAEAEVGEYPFDSQYYLGAKDGVYDKGTISDKWRLFFCPRIPGDQILIGVNNQKEHWIRYARLKIHNLYL